MQTTHSDLRFRTWKHTLSKEALVVQFASQDGIEGGNLHSRTFTKFIYEVITETAVFVSFVLRSHLKIKLSQIVATRILVFAR